MGQKSLIKALKSNHANQVEPFRKQEKLYDDYEDEYYDDEF